LEGLELEKVDRFYGLLEYNIVNLYILLPFCYLMAIWNIFPRFGILSREKSGNPDLGRTKPVAAAGEKRDKGHTHVSYNFFFDLEIQVELS
jgi:hypothetical protein